MPQGTYIHVWASCQVTESVILASCPKFDFWITRYFYFLIFEESCAIFNNRLATCHFYQEHKDNNFPTSHIQLLFLFTADILTGGRGWGITVAVIWIFLWCWAPFTAAVGHAVKCISYSKAQYQWHGDCLLFSCSGFDGFKSYVSSL